MRIIQFFIYFSNILSSRSAPEAEIAFHPSEVIRANNLIGWVQCQGAEPNEHMVYKCGQNILTILSTVAVNI